MPLYKSSLCHLLINNNNVICENKHILVLERKIYGRENGFRSDFNKLIRVVVVSPSDVGVK